MKCHFFQWKDQWDAGEAGQRAQVGTTDKWDVVQSGKSGCYAKAPRFPEAVPAGSVFLPTSLTLVVNDAFLATTLARFSSLAVLDLTNCGAVGDEAVAGVVPELARTLTHLNLLLCRHVGGSTVHALSGCASLAWLNLSRCDGVSDDTIAPLRPFERHFNAD